MTGDNTDGRERYIGCPFAYAYSLTLGAESDIQSLIDSHWLNCHLSNIAPELIYPIQLPLIL